MQQRRMSGVTRMYEKLKTLKDKLQKMKTNRANRQIGQTFHFSPFSRKQKQVLTWWCKESPVHDMDGVIADGAIRSGKTISIWDFQEKTKDGTVTEFTAQFSVKRTGGGVNGVIEFEVTMAVQSEMALLKLRIGN